ncbi:HECA2 protein, partial [Anseranas semipalmata]|nr:HECA2 protein [Anseranas semipalmata]
LLLLLHGSSIAVEIAERRLAEEGSSVMMHAPAIKNVNFTEWEYIRDGTPEFILQYYADTQSSTVYSAYQDRVVFYPKNGSLLLQKLREMDSGVYKATVDLMQDKARTTLLEVIKPMPQPKLLSTSNLAGSLIELTCMLPQGTVAAVSWKKDGHPLPPEKCYQLTQNTTTLQIRKADKSDCGSYSCNISNAVSWKEAALDLIVTGLTATLHAAQRMTIAALVLTAISAFSFVIWLRQPGKCRLGKKAWRWLMMSIKGLLCISSVLLLAASIIWMWEEGRHVIVYITATTLVVNLFFTSLLLHNFHQLHERGCSEAVDLTISYIPAALAALLMLSLLFLW